MIDFSNKIELKYPNSYREALYNGKGLLGLSQKDWDAWQQEYADEIKGLSFEEQNKHFNNKVLEDLTRNMGSMDDIKALEGGKLTPEEKRQMMYRIAMEHDVDGRSDAVEQKNLGLKLVGADINALVSLVTDNWEFMSGHDLSFSNFRNKYNEISQIEQDIATKWEAQRSRPTARQIAREKLNNMAEPKKEELTEYFNALPEDKQIETLQQLDAISSNISPEYNNYYSKLNLSWQERADLVTSYGAWREIGGDNFANKQLQNAYTDILANKQTRTEKILNTAETFGETTISGLASSVGAAYGIGKGIWTNAEMLLTNNYDHLSEDQKAAVRNMSWYVNDITEWAEALGSTGVWDRHKQLQYAEAGMHDNPIFSTVKQQEQFLSWNTPYEVLGSAGYATAALLEAYAGAGLIKVGAKAATAAAKVMKLNPIASKAAIAKGANFARLTAPAMQSGGEATLVGIGSKNTSYDAAMDVAKTDYTKKIKDAISEDIFNLSATEIYSLLDKYAPGASSIIKDNEPNKYGMSYSSRQLAIEILSKNPAYSDIVAKEFGYDKELELAEQKALRVASERGAVAWLVSMGVVSAGNYTAQLSLQAPSVRKAVSAKKATSTRNKIINEHVDFSMIDGKPQWTGKEVTKGMVRKERGEEILWEGLVEEYSQSGIDKYNQFVAASQMQQYLSDKYIPNENTDAFVDDLAEYLHHLDQRFYAANQSLGNIGYVLTDKEVLKEAVYGSLGALIGNPAINLNVRWSGREKGENIASYAGRLLPVTWRALGNPFNVASEAAERTRENQLMAEYLQGTMEDPNILASLVDAVGSLNFMKRYQDALDDGDEEKLKDELLKNQFQLIAMLQSLGDNTYAIGLKESVKRRTQFNTDNLADPNSDESKVVRDYAAQNNLKYEEMTAEQREEALSEMKSAAVKVSELLDFAEKQMKEYDEMFGDEVSMEAKHAMLYNAVILRDASQRIEEGAKIPASVLSYFDNTYSDSRADATKVMHALYGSKDKFLQQLIELETLYEHAKKESAKLEEAAKQNKTRENIFKYVNSAVVLAETERELDRMRKIKKEVNKDTKENVTSTNAVSARDILSMPAEYRQAVVKKYTNDHTSAQGKEVQAIKTIAAENGIANIEDAIYSLGRLTKIQEDAKIAQREYLQNPIKVQQLTNKARAKAANAIVERKYKHFADKNSDTNVDYSTFRNAAYQTLETVSQEESRAARNQMEQSPYWEEFNKEYSTHMDAMGAIYNTQSYQTASKEQQNTIEVLGSAYFDYRQNEGGGLNLETTTASDIENTLNSLSLEDINKIFTRRGLSGLQLNLEDAKKLFINTVYEAQTLYNDEKKRKEPKEVGKVLSQENAPKTEKLPEKPTTNTMPKIVTTEEELNKIPGITKDIKEFLTKNKVFENIVRLHKEGKLKAKTPIYFTVKKIGESNEVLHLIADENGTLNIKGKKYSIIGLELNDDAFTSQEKEDSNIGTILERTGVIAEVNANRNTEETVTLYSEAEKTGQRLDTIVERLDIHSRKVGNKLKDEVVYHTPTGQGTTTYTSTVYASSISDTVLPSGKTAIQVLSEYLNTPTENRSVIAENTLLALDYSNRHYQSTNYILPAFNKDWDSLLRDPNKKEELQQALLDINDKLHNLYYFNSYKVAAKRDGNIITFELVSSEALSNSQSTPFDLSTGTITSQDVLQRVLESIALGSVTTGKNNEVKARVVGHGRYASPVLSFEIGLREVRSLKKQKIAPSQKKAIYNTLKDKIRAGILSLKNTVMPSAIAVSFTSTTTSISESTPTKNTDSPSEKTNTTVTKNNEEVNTETGQVVTTSEDAITTKIEKEASERLQDSKEENEKETAEEKENKEVEEATIDSALSSLADKLGDGDFLLQTTGKRAQYIREIIDSYIEYHTNNSSDVNLYNDSIKALQTYVNNLQVKREYKESREDAKLRLEREVNKYLSNAKWARLVKRVHYTFDGNYVNAVLEFYSLKEALTTVSKRILDSLSTEELESKVKRIREAGQATDVVLKHIKAKDRALYEQSIQKHNPNMLHSEIMEALDFLHSLENNPETNLYVKTVLKWLKEDTIYLPRDNEQIKALFDLVRRKGINIEKYKSPSDAWLAVLSSSKVSPIPQPAPDLTKYIQEGILSISDVQEVNGESVVIYEIEDSERGLETTCQLLADSFAKDKEDGSLLGSSRWCLSTFNYNKTTGKATPTDSARNYWSSYSTMPKKIALWKGKPVAFYASNKSQDEWWDFNDGENNNWSGWSSIQQINLEEAATVYTEGDTSGVPTQQYSYGHTSVVYTPNTGYTSYIVNTANELLTKELVPHLGMVRYRFVLNNNETFSYVTSERSTPQLRYGQADTLFSPSQTVEYHFDVTYNEYTKRISVDIRLLDIVYQDTHIPTDQKLRGKINVISAKLSQSIDIDKIKSLASEFSNHHKNGNKQFISNSRIRQINDVLNEEIKSLLPSLHKDLLEVVNEAVKNYKEQLENMTNNKNKTAYIPTAKSNEDRTIATDIIINQIDNLIANNANRMLQNNDYYIEENSAPSVSNNITQVTASEVANILGYASEESVKNSDAEAINAISGSILRRMADKYMQKPAMEDLSKKLRNILHKYHIEVLEGPIQEVFGDDVLGAYDALQKIVYLAETKDRNALTEPEEFAHAFFKLMGAVYRRNKEKFPHNALYTELIDEVVNTELYQEVVKEYGSLYRNNTNVLAEEALGKALGAVLADRHETLQNIKDASFFKKVALWFWDTLKSLIEDRAFKKGKLKGEEKLVYELKQMANSILDGTYTSKYIQKFTDELRKHNNIKVDAHEAIRVQNEKDGGRTLSIVKAMNNLKGKLAGSIALAFQGSVYRKDSFSLHDLDFSFNPEDHGLYEEHPELKNMTYSSVIRAQESRNSIIQSLQEIIEQSQFMAKIKEEIPNFHITNVFVNRSLGITISGLVTDNLDLVERFKAAEGNLDAKLSTFTEEEKNQFSIVDIFASKQSAPKADISDNVGIDLENQSRILNAKLLFGRLKDIMDYQDFKPDKRFYKRNPSGRSSQMLMQGSQVAELTADIQKETQQEERSKKVESMQQSANAFIESWDSLTEALRERLAKRGITKQVWDNLMSEEKDKALECAK